MKISAARPEEFLRPCFLGSWGHACLRVSDLIGAATRTRKGHLQRKEGGLEQISLASQKPTVADPKVMLHTVTFDRGPRAAEGLYA